MGKSSRQDIANLCHKLHSLGFVVASSGNISIRTENGFLITPSSVRKDSLGGDDIVECDSQGNFNHPKNEPSSELEMHKAVYALRDDVNAAIHAHPIHCVACTLAGISLDSPILPEMIVYTGPIPTVPFAIPGSKEQAKAVLPYVKDYDALLLERHGALVLGRDLSDAFCRLEQLEYIARITFLARTMGPVEELADQDISKIFNYAKEKGRELPKGSQKI